MSLHIIGALLIALTPVTVTATLILSIDTHTKKEVYNKELTTLGKILAAPWDALDKIERITSEKRRKIIYKNCETQ